MSKFHSSVTRRDFMKALGLAGAGLGAAAATAPVLHDLDELMAAPTAAKALPWYVKEREILNPTVEVDWNLVQRWDNRNNAQSTYAASHYPSYAGASERSAKGNVRRDERYANDEKGYDLKWRALNQAKSDRFSSPSGIGFAGPAAADLGDSNVELGKPKWTGSPEEASRLVMAATRFVGAQMVGFAELNETYRNKLVRVCSSTGNNVVYPNPLTTGQFYVYGDVDRAVQENFEGGTRCIIPNKDISLISWATAQTPELRKSNSLLANTNTPTVEKFHTNIKVRLARFLNALGGYQLFGNTGDQSFTVNAELSLVLTGDAETSRQQNYVNDLNLGPNHNSSNMMTDLKLAPTPPIDAGMWKFCWSCGICADQCPSFSIATEKEPTFEVPLIEGLPNVTKIAGPKMFFTNMIGCRNYTTEFYGCGPRGVVGDEGGGRSCFGVCPFGEDRAALAHNVIRTTMGTTSLFNGFFAGMADVFGTGQAALRPDDWWNMGLPSLGLPTHINATKGQWKM